MIEKGILCKGATYRLEFQMQFYIRNFYPNNNLGLHDSYPRRLLSQSFVDYLLTCEYKYMVSLCAS